MRPDFLDEYDFFTGVPDSLLSPFCNYLMRKYGLGERHIIAANEGNAVGLAAGYYLATGKTPVVYLQNSGIGNIINPIASLLNEYVYGIPVVFVVGWRGEPGVHDEPQHVFQGMVTQKLLEDVGVETCVISPDTTEADIMRQKVYYAGLLNKGRSVAWLIRKDAISLEKSGETYTPTSFYTMKREEILAQILTVSDEDIIVSTTGKTSRELFELREKNGREHGQDFLTVGSMGHSSSIALGIALKRPEKRVWCIDGDGAALMHMGAMATIAAYGPKNLKHIVINNESHESVGGLPTVAGKIDLQQIARGCGYSCILGAQDAVTLRSALMQIKAETRLSFLEVKAAIGSRATLGRPTMTPKQNKKCFMDYLRKDMV